jgi:hypothetical protein
MTQAVEHLLCKLKVLNLNPCFTHTHTHTHTQTLRGKIPHTQRNKLKSSIKRHFVKDGQYH